MNPVPPRLTDVLIEGRLIRLRPLRASDADAAFPLVHRVREVLDWLCWQGPESLDELRAAYSSWRTVTSNGTDYHLAIESLDGDRFLGTASLRYADHPFVGDLGYWLGVPYHGRGYGTELIRLLTHIGFEWLGSTAMTAEVFPGNVASEAVLARCGFRLERDGESDASRCATRAAAPCGGDTEAAGADRARRLRLFLAMRSDRPAGAERPRVERHEVEA